MQQSPYAPTDPAAAGPGGLPPQGYGPPPSPGWHYGDPPIEMRYVEGRPIPPGYHLESRPRKGLVVAGPIIFGAPYVISASVAASSHFTPDRWLYLPVVGPFADLGARGSGCTRDTVVNSPIMTSTIETCSDDTGQRFFLMLDGLLQTAGATMLILGLALPQHLLVRDDAPFNGSRERFFSLTLGPKSFGRSGYGVGAAGTF